MTMIRPILILALLSTAACAPLYTPETTWRSDQPADNFRPDMTACVQQFDPSHVGELDNAGEYEASGAFIDTARTQAVVSCMEAKGWNASGPEWYHGPVR